MTLALTGPQKAAVVMANLEPNQATEVMKHLSEGEAEVLSAEIIRMRAMSAEQTAGALHDFNSILAGHLPPGRGGQDAARRLLEATYGAERAEGMMGRVSSSMAGTSLDFLNAADPAQLGALVENEMAPTIALILAHLRPQNAAALLAVLPDVVRTDATRAVASMGTATKDAITVVSDTMRSRTGVFSSRENQEQVGGVDPLVEIIGRADAQVEKELLEALDEKDPELAEEIRSRMVTFADLVKLDPQDAQKVLRGVDMRVLALALKNASDAVDTVIRQNISQRNREALDGEIRLLGPVRLSQVEEARAQIVQTIRTMAATGDIQVNRDTEDQLV